MGEINLCIRKDGEEWSWFAIFGVLMCGDSKLEFFSVRFGFLSFFEIGFTKKMSQYSDPMTEKLELFLVKAIYFTIRFRFLSFFEMGFTKKTSKYSDQMTD